MDGSDRKEAYRVPELIQWDENPSAGARTVNCGSRWTAASIVTEDSFL